LPTERDPSDTHTKKEIVAYAQEHPKKKNKTSRNKKGLGGISNEARRYNSNKDGLD